MDFQKDAVKDIYHFKIIHFFKKSTTDREFPAEASKQNPAPEELSEKIARDTEKEEDVLNAYTSSNGNIQLPLFPANQPSANKEISAPWKSHWKEAASEMSGIPSRCQTEHQKPQSAT